MTKQMCVCRVDRVEGDGGGLGTEILRRKSNGTIYSAPNIDDSRTYLNVAIVKAEGIGGNAIVHAINNRIKNANITRKVADNQCRALVFYLSGTHEKMKEIESQGRLNEWTNDCHEWLAEQFGAENIVSMELHRDEFTPHIHAVVVPITTEQRKRRAREGEVKRNVTPKVRLSADHFMKKATMSGWQDSFYERMKKYGLERGVKGSKNRHKTMNEYYRELQEEKIPEAERHLQVTQAKVTELESTLADLSPKKEQAERRVKGLTTMVANLNDRILDLEGEIAKREISLEDTDNLQKQHDELLAKLEDKKQKLQAAHDKLWELSDQYKNILDKIEEAKEQLSDTRRSKGTEESELKNVIVRLRNEERRLTEVQNEVAQKEKELNVLSDEGEDKDIPSISVIKAYEYSNSDFPSISAEEIPTFKKKEWAEKKNKEIEEKCRRLVDKARQPLEEQINKQNDVITEIVEKYKAEKKLRKGYECKNSLRTKLDSLAKYAVKAIVDYITSDKKAEDLRRQLLWAAKQAMKKVFEHAFKIEPYGNDLDKATIVTFKAAYSVLYELYKLVSDSSQRMAGHKFVEDAGEEQVHEISKRIQTANEKESNNVGLKR